MSVAYAVSNGVLLGVYLKLSLCIALSLVDGDSASWMSA